MELIDFSSEWSHGDVRLLLDPPRKQVAGQVATAGLSAAAGPNTQGRKRIEGKVQAVKSEKDDRSDDRSDDSSDDSSDDCSEETSTEHEVFLVLYANQTVLEMWSPVFLAMFKHEFKEGATKDVMLPGKKFKDVLRLLRVMHPPNLPVTLANAYRLLPLAHEYQIQAILNRCEEKFLRDIPQISNIKLADDFGLQKLRTHCIKQIGTFFPLEDIKNDASFKSLTDASRYELLCKRIESVESVMHHSDHFVRAGDSYKSSHCSDRCKRHSYTRQKVECAKCLVLKTRAFYKGLFE